MKEDGFEFLELFGKIDEEYIYQALQPWKGQTRRYVMYHMGKKVACLFIIMLLGFCMVFHNQVYAAISRFTTMMGEILGLSDDLTPYTDIINTTQRQDGTGITLKEVIWTGNSLLASVHVEGADDGAGISAGESIEINGEEKECDSTKVYSREDIEGTGGDYVVEWDYGSSLQITGKVNIKMEIVLHRHMEDFEGQAFVFAFSASEEELQKNTLRMELNQKIETGDIEAVVKEMSLNSVAGSIQVECGELPLEEKQYYFKITDMDGKDFLYYLVNIQNGVYTFQNDGEPPSMGNEWLDVQMYALPFEWEEGTGDSDSTGEQLSEVFQVDNGKMEPVGQKFRVAIKNSISMK